MKYNESQEPCKKLHFAKILQPHTDESLGDCSFLNTCFHMDTCKYIHYEVDAEDIQKQRYILLTFFAWEIRLTLNCVEVPPNSIYACLLQSQKKAFDKDFKKKFDKNQPLSLSVCIY